MTPLLHRNLQESVRLQFPASGWFSLSARPAGASVALAGEGNATEPSPTLGRQLLWTALAATGSYLLLAVTNHICQNIASIPLLWIAPLSIYLLSFILCFDSTRWYLRYPLSYQHVTELVAERGVEVDASCIWRWVQAYAPELNKRCRPHLKPTNKSYRIDETYIKVKGEDRYLYRALDSRGQTIDFLLTAKRDTAAAKRFLRRAIDASGNPMPRVMNGQEPGLSGRGGSAES